jgi:hypothetical protein
VTDDWMMNVFGLTMIQPVSSTVGVLDRTKIGKPEGTCETLSKTVTGYRLQT